MQFKYDCPHCLSASAGFNVAFQWPVRHIGNESYLLAVCGVCNNGIVVRARDTSGNSFPDAIRSSFNFPNYHLVVVKTWPSSQVYYPEDMPSSVGTFYKQGVENLRGERWDAAGAMFRKTLDVSTKIMSPDLKSITLFKRIEKLVSGGFLTEAMGAWSHEIRLDGNDAVHDEEPETKGDAVSLQKFTEAFLTYAFSLPSMVARNRAKRELTAAPQEQ